jgi:predicted TIM-barrel fold metal-dependent hydrolase
MRITHLPAVTELVRQCPDVTFILERLGKPAIKYHQLYQIPQKTSAMRWYQATSEKQCERG